MVRVSDYRPRESDDLVLGRRDFLQRGIAAAGLVAGGGWLAACGGGSKGSTTTAASSTTGAAARQVKVAWTFNGPADDGGWSLSQDIGRRAVEKAFPNVKTSYVESVPFSQEASQTFQRLVSEGNEMLFVGTAYGDFLSQVAKANPKVFFGEVGGTVFSENEWAFYPNQWDASYIVGVAAGLMTKSNKLGYIASFPISSIKSTASALLMGARSVNPKAEVQVVSINSWFSPQGARQAANALIDGGADFLIGIMDEPAYLQVAEKRGVLCAGWNLDMRKYAPKQYVSGVVFNWNKYYVDTVKQLIDGTFKPPSTVALLQMPGEADRDAWGDAVPEKVRKEADAARDKIINDKFNIFTGPLKDVTGKVQLKAGESLTPDQIYALSWTVEGIKGLK